MSVREGQSVMRDAAKDSSTVGVFWHTLSFIINMTSDLKILRHRTLTFNMFKVISI